MSQIGFKVKITAPYFTEIPQEIKENWLSGSKKAAPETYKGIKKAIKTGGISRKRLPNQWLNPSPLLSARNLFPRAVVPTGI